MATFYVQLENKLLQISGDLTTENISKALGYVPVSPNVTNELSQRVDNITFDSLKDNPFLQDGSGELNIVDEAGNIIAKIDAEGIHSVDFIAGEHRLSDKTDKTYVDEAIKNVEVDLTGYATEEYVNNIDFYNINNNPIVNNGDGKLLFVDENGYIGLQLEEDGLYVKDVITDGHTLSQKADKSDIPSLDGYATESYVNTELENYATKEDIKDIANNSTIIELSGKVATLIGEDADKSIRNIANEELLAQLLKGNDNFQTLQELAAWIDEHPESASAMNEAIQKNASDITNTLTSAKSYTDKTVSDIDFYNIKNNPIVNSEDGTLTFVDESGYIGLKVTEDGLIVKDVVTSEHTLSSKADKSELPTKTSDLTNDSGFITINDVPEVEIPSLDEYVKSEDLPNFDEFAKTSDIPSLDGYATEEWVNNNNYATEEDLSSIEFNSLQNNPIVEDSNGEFNLVDDLGNVGFKVNQEGLFVKDVIAGEHILSNKVDKTYIDDLRVTELNAILVDTDAEADDPIVSDYVTENELETALSGKMDKVTLATVATSGSYNDLTNKPTIPSAVTENTVSDWGFTKNAGTYSKPSGGIPKSDLASAVQTSLGKADTALQSYIEQYKGTVTGVKINGTTKNPSSGVVDIGTVITAHQDISGKQDKLISGTNIKTINGTSLLGSGDIVISGGAGGGSGTYPEHIYTEADGDLGGGESGGFIFEIDGLQPNVFHVFPECRNLSRSLGPETSGVTNEYLFQFTSGATATSLTLPDDIKWANDTPPTIAENMIYQISILKGLASVLEFSNKPKTKQCKLDRGYDTIILEFEDGMTWNDWVNSSYNVYSLYVSDERVHISSMFIVSEVTPNDVMEEKDYVNLIYD